MVHLCTGPFNPNFTLTCGFGSCWCLCGLVSPCIFFSGQPEFRRQASFHSLLIFRGHTDDRLLSNSQPPLHQQPMVCLWHGSKHPSMPMVPAGRLAHGGCSNQRVDARSIIAYDLHLHVHYKCAAAFLLLWNPAVHRLVLGVKRRPPPRPQKTTLFPCSICSFNGPSPPSAGLCAIHTGHAAVDPRCGWICHV